MPFNGAGTYSLPSNSWNPAVSGATISSADWNSTGTDLETALSTALTKDGQTNPTANLPMAGFKHTGVNTNSGGSRSEYASGAVLQDGSTLDAGATAGTSTAYTATLAPSPGAYADKQLFRVQFNAACGGNPTINFNTLGAKKIYKNVSGTATQLSANDVPANFIGLLRYDSALDTAAGGFWLVNADGVTSIVDATNGGLSFSAASGGVITASLAPNDLTAKASRVLADSVVINDVAGGNVAKKVLQSVLLSGTSLQSVNTTTGAVATGTTTIPNDDTIPQSGEGTEFMTQAITPKDATSTLDVDVIWVGSVANSGEVLTMALFQDSGTDAVAVTQATASSSGLQITIPLRFRMTAGSTSATTFKVRVGGTSGNTITFNGSGANRRMGGKMASSITITEYAA